METVAGTRIGRRGRAPRSREERRKCTRDECETALNRYNLGDTCYVHAPTRYRRVRGVIVRPA